MYVFRWNNAGVKNARFIGLNMKIENIIILWTGIILDFENVENLPYLFPGDYFRFTQIFWNGSVFGYYPCRVEVHYIVVQGVHAGLVLKLGEAEVKITKDVKQASSWFGSGRWWVPKNSWSPWLSCPKACHPRIWFKSGAWRSCKSRNKASIQ